MSKKIFGIITIAMIVIVLIIILLMINGKGNRQMYGDTKISISGDLLYCMSFASKKLDILNEFTIEDYIDYSLKNNFKIPNGGTSHEIIEKFYEEKNCEVETIKRLDKQKLKNALSTLNPVLMLCANGNFTTTGQYIVLYDYDALNETLSIYDPYSDDISKERFDINLIVNNASKALEQEISYWKIAKR